MSDVTSILFARITNNVLPDEDGPIARVLFAGSSVVEVELVVGGKLELGVMPKVGWSVEELVAWLRYDSTGSHPETYHALSTRRDFFDDFGETELCALLGGAVAT